MGAVDAAEWVCVVCGCHIQITEWVERWICINFVWSLNLPLWKLFWWFRRLQLWVTGDWQLHHNNVPTHASHLVKFFGETSNPPGDSASLQPRFGTLWLLAFPKTKITFERKEISGHQWDSGKKWLGNWWQLGELWEVPRCLLWKGTEASLSYVQMFLVSSLLIVSIFHVMWLDIFWTNLVCGLDIFISSSFIFSDYYFEVVIIFSKK